MKSAIAYAIPVFMAFITVEFLLGMRGERKLYRFHDAVTNLSCGIGSQLLGLGTGAVSFLIYGEFARTLAPWQIEDSWLTWIFLLFAVGLGYYCFHRAAHRVNFLWACHAVHHQSEEYNYSVALRQSWFSGFFSWAFYLPIVLVGFSPLSLALVKTVNLLYQFWVHTRLMSKIPGLDWLFNMPSHHRVHHAINPEYIDKNYAGMFIIWDRMFGTFVEEREEPVYGTVVALESWSPLWANLYYWKAIGALSGRCDGVADRIRAWFAPPEWRPASLGGDAVIPEVSRDTQRRYDTRASLGLDIYVALQFALGIPVVMWVLLAYGSLDLSLLALLALAYFMGLEAWGALFEGRRWGLWMEWGRLCLGAMALVLLVPELAASSYAVGGMVAAVLVQCFLSYRYAGDVQLEFATDGP